MGPWEKLFHEVFHDMDDATISHISAHDDCGIVQLSFHSSAIDYDPWARPYAAHNNLCSLDIFQVNGGGRRRWNLKQGRISISQENLGWLAQLPLIPNFKRPRDGSHRHTHDFGENQ